MDTTHVLQCHVVCCSVLQRVAACCSVLQRVAGSTLIGLNETGLNETINGHDACFAACCCVMQRVAASCSVLQRIAVCCSVLQCVP